MTWVRSCACGSAGCPGAGGAALTGDAVVVGVLTPGNGSLAGSSGGTIEVTVAVGPADAGAVACDAAAGSVAVVVLPPAGAG